MNFREFLDTIAQWYPKPGEASYEARKEDAGDKAELIHAGFGIVGEANEVSDLIKKHVFYRQPIDPKKMLRELGDAYHFLDRITDMFGFTDDECRAENISKLSIRFGNTYSHEAAIAKADQKEEMITAPASYADKFDWSFLTEDLAGTEYSLTVDQIDDLFETGVIKKKFREPGDSSRGEK